MYLLRIKIYLLFISIISLNVFSTHISVPEGETLPAKVIRVTSSYKSLKTNSTFNSEGKKSFSGYDINISFISPILEYGISDNLSFQLAVPFTVINKFDLNKDKFLKSRRYQKEYRKKLDKTSLDLSKKTKGELFNNSEDCQEAIQRGYSLPVTVKTRLSTGEYVISDSRIPIRSQIKNTILDSVNSQSKYGSLGLGDMQVGLLYRLYKSKHLLSSIGAGVKIPTGDYNIPSGKRPLLREGLYDLGIRLNLAISPFKGLWLSYQQQLEGAINNKVTKKVSNILNTQTFSTLESTFQKKGLDLKTLLKANYGFGALHQKLKSISLQSSYYYNEKRATSFFQENTSRKYSHLASVGGSLSLLPYGLPISSEVNYIQSIKGSENSEVINSLEASLKFYYKF